MCRWRWMPSARERTCTARSRWAIGASSICCRQFAAETASLKRIVQVGNQGNSSPAWGKVRELVQQGAIGRLQHILAGYYRDGDWGERMPIPDPEAVPGPDLDWEGFLGDAPKVPFTVDRFFSWRKYLDYAGGPCTDLFPHVLTPFVSALGLNYPSLAVASGGIFKYNTYDREVPDTFNMSLDFPEEASAVLICTLANEYPTEPAIRGDEGTLTLQDAGAWESGFGSMTVIPKKGAPRVAARFENRIHLSALEELHPLRSHPREARQRRGVRAQGPSRDVHGHAGLSAQEGRPVRPAEKGDRAVSLGRLPPMAAALSLLVSGAVAGAAGGETLRVEPAAAQIEWTVFHGDKKLLVYRSDPRQFKPYVKELCTIRGDNLLRDAPKDHLHHHGLMYAVRVNGLNFWEEISGSGVEKPIETLRPELGASPAGLPQATIRQTLHWLAPQEAFLPDSPKWALLIERRTLVLTVNEAQDEVALCWKSHFEVGGKTNTVILAGASYFGLGARFLEELDPVAEHFNSEGRPDLTGNAAGRDGP